MQVKYVKINFCYDLDHGAVQKRALPDLVFHHAEHCNDTASFDFDRIELRWRQRL